MVIFGTGRLYQKYIKVLKKENEVIALCDNKAEKWGTYIDGIVVIPPKQLLEIDYDFIFILNSYAFEIRQQLIKLGVNMLKVYDLDRLDLILSEQKTSVYNVNQHDSSNGSIVLFSHALSPSGANVILFRAAVIYNNMGYEVSIVSRCDGELRQDYLREGIKLYITSDVVAFANEYKRVLLNADRIIVNTFWFYYLLQELEDGFKAKSIWWIHETFPYRIVNKAQFDSCVSKLKAVAVVSPRVYEITKGTYDYGDSVMLPWGIPERRDNSTKTNCNRVIITIIGAVDSKVKGQDLFMKAVELLTEEDRERAEFWIVGPGKLDAEETEIANRYDSIKILGVIEQNKIPELYSKIDVVVCASRQEALSVVTVEAFMNEKLAIVSDAAGVVDYMVPGEDGLIFPSGDHEKLADYMHWAINHMDEARAIGQRSRRVYDKYFTMQAFKERLVQLI